MQNSTTLPDPDAYLNHLPSDQAAQFEVARNFYLTIVGVRLATDAHSFTYERCVPGCSLGCSSLYSGGCPDRIQMFQSSYFLLHILKVRQSFIPERNP